MTPKNRKTKMNWKGVGIMLLSRYLNEKLEVEKTM
jgi:hypothetical protein